MLHFKRFGFRPLGVLLVGVFTLLLSACGGGGGGEGAEEESHPIPTAETVTPSETLAGGGDLAITVYGSNFVDKAVVRWNPRRQSPV